MQIQIIYANMQIHVINQFSKFPALFEIPDCFVISNWRVIVIVWMLFLALHIFGVAGKFTVEIRYISADQ